MLLWTSALMRSFLNTFTAPMVYSSSTSFNAAEYFFMQMRPQRSIVNLCLWINIFITPMGNSTLLVLSTKLSCIDLGQNDWNWFLIASVIPKTKHWFHRIRDSPEKNEKRCLVIIVKEEIVRDLFGPIKLPTEPYCKVYIVYKTIIHIVQNRLK